MIPYDDDATDVLHLVLNSYGSATTECFDTHLRREYPDDAQLTELTCSIRDLVNTRLKQSGVLIEFGSEKVKDVNGPKLRRMLLDSSLLFDLIVLMLPLYELLEEKKQASVDDHLYTDELGKVTPYGGGGGCASATRGDAKTARATCEERQSQRLLRQEERGMRAPSADQEEEHAHHATVTGLPNFAALAGADEEEEEEEENENTASPMDTEPTETEPDEKEKGSWRSQPCVS